MSRTPAEHVDVVVVGGSYAGMSAALQLVRARRQVLVIDGGAPRNRNALAAHGFIGSEGMAPDQIAARARHELQAYPTLSWRTGIATRAQALDGRFQIHCDPGGTVTADRLVLAHGVTDTLPQIDGLAERWGRSVLHCPYCHGYAAMRPIGSMPGSDSACRRAVW